MYNDKEDSMNSLKQDFTDKLYAAYEANPKYAAMENAISHNGLLTSLEKRTAAVENAPVSHWISPKTRSVTKKHLAAAGCLRLSILSATR